jgi:hypothetical protein
MGYYPGSGGNVYATTSGYGQNAMTYSGNAMRSKSQLPGSSPAEELLKDLLGQKGIEWPLGLRILPPGAETQALRGEVETFIKLALLQERSGKVNRKLVSKVERDLKKLRRFLDENVDRLDVPPETIREAKRFLRRLRDFVEAL